MILKLANRKVDNLDVRVFDPSTGIALAPDTVIDTDTLPFLKHTHYMQAYRDGDMVEVQPTDFTNKKVKE